jgi:hypothetical protein
MHPAKTDHQLHARLSTTDAAFLVTHLMNSELLRDLANLFGLSAIHSLVGVKQSGDAAMDFLQVPLLSETGAPAVLCATLVVCFSKSALCFRVASSGTGH